MHKFKSIPAGVLLLGAGLLFSSCTINVNQNGNANTNANANAVRNASVNRVSPAGDTAPSAGSSAQAAKDRWSVVVCTSRASAVTMSAGPSEDNSDVFATYKENGGQKIFALPERVQNLTKLHFKATGSESNPVEMCVLYDGRPKKRVAFDEGSESHIVDASDGDDDDCRCTK